MPNIVTVIETTVTSLLVAGHDDIEILEIQEIRAADFIEVTAEEALTLAAVAEVFGEEAAWALLADSLGL